MGLLSLVKRYRTGTPVTFTDPEGDGFGEHTFLLTALDKSGGAYHRRFEELAEPIKKSKARKFRSAWKGKRGTPEYNFAKLQAEQLSSVETLDIDRRALAGTVLKGFPDWVEPKDQLAELKKMGFEFHKDGRLIDLLDEVDEDGFRKVHERNAELLLGFDVIYRFVRAEGEALADIKAERVADEKKASPDTSDGT